MKKQILGIWLALLPIVGLQAQIYDANGQYVDTVFHDHVNRQAEDFVRAYVCFAEPTDWKDDILGVNGHAFIRLVCETFNLDYCYSYESEHVNDQMDKYLQGKLKMGMYSIPTEEYIKDYQNWHRAVHQYKLNIPADAEQRLWEIMDNHVMDGNQLKLDLNRRGCAITVIRYVKRALGDYEIVYPNEFKYQDLSRREILYQNMAATPWLRLIFGLLIQDIYDKDCDMDEKLFLPSDVAEVWSQANLLGHPMIEYDSDIVVAKKVEVVQPWITPLCLTWVLLVITIVVRILGKIKYSKLDNIYSLSFATVQAVLGGALIYLALFTQMFSTSAGLLMVLFNPLPLICWKWRQYWQLPMAILMLIAILVFAFWPHMLMDPAFLVFGLCYVVIYGRRKK